MSKLMFDAPVSAERVIHWGLALGIAVAAAFTAGPLLATLVHHSAATAAAEEPNPLTGFWESHVNGDSVNTVLKVGNTVWSATEGGGLVSWDVTEGSHVQYVAPQDGLLSNVVNDLALDSSGKLWVATDRGLTRLDTATGAMVHYSKENTVSMPARVVTALAFAPNGKLWVGFGQQWDKDIVDARTRVPGTFLPGGLARFDPATGVFEAAIHPELDGNPSGQRYRTLPSENITRLTFDNAGLLWIGTRPYYVWDSDYCPPGEDCSHFAGYWVSVGGGLAGLRPGPEGLPVDWKNWSPGEEANCYSNHITDLAVDQAGRTWVAHQGRGLHVMLNGLTGGCNGGQIYYQRPRGGRKDDVGVKGNHIFSVDVDESGRVWMGTGENLEEGLGIAVLDHNNTFGDPRTPWDANTLDDLWTFIDVDSRPGSTNTLVSELYVREAGLRLLGTKDVHDGDGEGLRVFDEAGSWQKLRTADTGIPSNHVIDVAIHPGTLDVWVTFSHKGIARYDGEEWTNWRSFQAGPLVAHVTAKIISGSFSRIPVDFPDKAACDAAFPASRRFARFAQDPTLYRLQRCLTVQGKVYMEIDPDLAQPAEIGTNVFGIDRGPPSDVGTKVAFGPDGRVWAGGRESIWMTGKSLGSRCSTFPECWQDGGLGVYDGASWIVYDQLNYPPPTIPDQEVQAVIVDRDGKVWAGTGNPRRPSANGIGVFDPATGGWTYYEGRVERSQRAWITGVSDFDIDPATGAIYMSMHAGEVCVKSSPFGGGNCDQVRRMGGGVGRWNGTKWDFWSKTTGASIEAFGDPVGRDEGGEFSTILVDRVHRRIWAGGWTAEENSFHYNKGLGLNAVLNWCVAPRAGEPTLTPAPSPTLSGATAVPGPKTPTPRPTPDGNADECTSQGWDHIIWPDDGEVTSLAMDQDGNVWAGTHRNGRGLVPPLAGVKFWDGVTWYTLTTANTRLNSSEISGLARRSDEMWVGTRTRGLSVYVDRIAPTPTPTATASASPSATPTGTRDREDTPTPAITISPTPSRSTPATATTTSVTGLCTGNDTRCEFAFLPVVFQLNPRPPVTRTPTPTRTRTPVPSLTPTGFVPSSTPTNTLSPTATATRTGTPFGPSPTASRTRTPTNTATIGSTATPTQPPAREWEEYDGSAGELANSDFFGVSGTDPDHVWIVGDEGRVYFWDGTEFFQQIVPPQAQQVLRSVQFTSVARGFIAGDSGALIDTRNGGVNWRNANTGSFTDDWRGLAMFSDGGVVKGWALGHTRGTRLRFDGTTWDATIADRNTNHGYSDGVSSSDVRAYAIRDDGSGARMQIWDGNEWAVGPSTGPLYDMDMLNAGSGMAVGDRGTVWQFVDGVWQLMGSRPGTTGRSLRAVDVVSDNLAWAGGERTLMFRWDGAAWTSVPIQARNRDINAMWIDPTGTEGWAVGNGGLVLHYK